MFNVNFFYQSYEFMVVHVCIDIYKKMIFNIEKLYMYIVQVYIL